MNTTGATMRVVYYRNPIHEFVDGNPVMFALLVVVLVGGAIWLFRRRRTK